MTFHTHLTPVNAAVVPFDWPELRELGSGGFASVRELGPAEVLKLTCCSASNAWFEQARTRPRGWPAAFPAVYARLGDIAVDSDDMVFTGWRMERLFPLSDKRGAIAARSATVHARARTDLEATARPVIPDEEAFDALMSICNFCAVEPDEHWSIDANAALLLAGACDGDLRRGFLALHAFIHEHAVKLDVSNPRNVMMDCFGRLRLADPLTMRLDEPEASAALTPRSWLAARLPHTQRGFDVQTRWTAVPFATPQEAQAAAREATVPGIQTQVCTEQRAATLVGQEPAVVKAFEFGRELDTLLDGDLRARLVSQASLR